jgi:hypothetical protein
LTQPSWSGGLLPLQITILRLIHFFGANVLIPKAAAPDF